MSKKSWLVFTLFAVAGFLSLGYTAEISEAISAREQGDFSRALAILSEKAKEGDVNAIHEIGITYAQMGDHATAAKWIRDAAERGLAKSQSALGAMYMTGLGVPENAELGMYWHKKAAEQGFPDSQVTVYLAENDIGPKTSWECETEDTDPGMMSVSDTHVVLMFPTGETLILKRAETIDPEWIAGAADYTDKNFSIEIALNPKSGKTIRQIVSIDTREVLYQTEGSCIRVRE